MAGSSTELSSPEATTDAPSAPGTSVTVVGGGIAGITAALKLGKLGYKVKLIEARPFLGGNLSAHWDEKREENERVYHDVYPHMFSTFYTNFWELLEKDLATVGMIKEEHFEPRNLMKMLNADGGYDTITDGAPIKNTLLNLLRGPQPAADMIVWAYSLLDLMSQHGSRDRLLDQFSVNGFMRSKAYATERAARMHEFALLIIWSAHSYDISAAPYADFFRLALRKGPPLTWVMKGDLHNHLIKFVLAELERLGVDVVTNTQVTRIQVKNDRVDYLRLQPAKFDRVTLKPHFLERTKQKRLRTFCWQSVLAHSGI